MAFPCLNVWMSKSTLPRKIAIASRCFYFGVKDEKTSSERLSCLSAKKKISRWHTMQILMRTTINSMSF
ncbi:hypothetical protein AUM56_11980 [Cronobacter sakazakii]|nr:hypothetical protein [Cronobacter sakazakii]CCK03869.1 hypothetical protein BN129_2604 [Cronobacter sakazakii 701]EGT4258924.1 hypothetical protein [Cronobacter sakazakii]EGT4269957.1 hypothetical protein [Cronobacter sakazakii]EGT4300946.1 hypothetical protein [Cronobacter sakazakii]